MTDNLTPEYRRKTMQAVKAKGTGLERSIAAMLAGMRLKGWRRNVSDLPGKPDFVFDSCRLALFIDGCFWHGCPICRRPLPKANRDYWSRKVESNIRRAEKSNLALELQGWQVLHSWEHELKNPDSKRLVGPRIRAICHERSEVDHEYSNRSDSGNQSADS